MELPKIILFIIAIHSLFVAIAFFIYMLIKKVKKEKNLRETYMVEGMSIGLCIGSGFASAFAAEYIGLSILIGMLLGLLVGMDKAK